MISTLQSLISQQNQSSLSQYVFIGKIKIDKQFAFFVGISYKLQGFPGSRHNKKNSISENDQYNFSQYFNLKSSDIDRLNSSFNFDISSDSLFRISYIQHCSDEFQLQNSVEMSLFRYDKSIPQLHDIFYCDFLTIQQLCIWFGIVQDPLLNYSDVNLLQKISNISLQFKSLQ